jgi:hypothetical protein
VGIRFSFSFFKKDIKTVKKISQKEVIGLAVINDVEKEIKPEYLEALENKNTKYILWNQRNRPSEVAKLKEAV